MEGLIPFVFNALKKQRPQTAYRCLSETSSGRSYHMLLSGDSVDGGSSHRRTNSDFPAPPSSVGNFLSGKSEHLTNFATTSPSAAVNGLRQRGFTAAGHYQASARNTVAYGL